ncbi:hypothetical protein [Frigoriflavimonas asaccharolytica]|uniref:Lipoprotein n=1 Tax=Frigoriflavimonas asaccharolytica TaxID=2735899 RepID=A0A8J8G9Y2_9FLAO|nr:hypothetical protein [Frigoriflavimonas asaccharolytica]NRS92020.1 hypothetical protein [Frigoriflavimonas asaccharolytica]
MKTKNKFFLPATIALAASLTVYSCMLNIGVGGETGTTTSIVSLLSEHLLSPAKAQILSNEYTQNNYQKVNVGKPQAETKEVFYDLEVLEDYIKYVKKEAKKEGINNVGITIAFGQYPKNEIFDARLKNEYKGQQTVYLKATVDPAMQGNKVGKGGAEQEKTNGSLDKISALDFGRLSPPN